MKKGISYIETVIAIALSTMILTAVFSFVVHLYRVNSFAWQQSLAIEEARRGIDAMVKEIRSAQTSESGAYPIERADDKQLIFYSDVDNDGLVERVRYYLGSVVSGISEKTCYTNSKSGSCSVNFSNFYSGTLKSAQLRFSTEGDYGTASKYVNLYFDGGSHNTVCGSGCTKCAGTWQGTKVYDVAPYVSDNNLTLLADSSSNVDKVCNWLIANHAMMANFQFSWIEEIVGAGHELRRAITKPTGSPAQYLKENEVSKLITSYIVSDPPIFEYYDVNGEEIVDNPARLIDTRLVKTSLVINIDPTRPPQDFLLESLVNLRNLQ